jgi:uncharacterized protein (DUF433 family)
MRASLPIEGVFSDPQLHGGQPTVAGTSLRVIDVIGSYLYSGLSPDELAVNFSLTLGQIYAVLAYYHQNRVKVEADLQADETRAEEARLKLAAAGKLLGD